MMKMYRRLPKIMFEFSVDGKIEISAFSRFSIKLSHNAYLYGSIDTIFV